MKEYVIAMKSGAQFVVKVKDLYVLIEEFKSTLDPRATVNIFSAGGVAFDINDLSAIYPLESEHKKTAPI